jgi:hypothetical protein
MVQLLHFLSSAKADFRPYNRQVEASHETDRIFEHKAKFLSAKKNLRRCIPHNSQQRKHLDQQTGTKQLRQTKKQQASPF